MNDPIRENQSIDEAAEVTPCANNELRRNCRFVKPAYEGMDGERYRCTVPGCNYSYFLDYEDMK